MATATRTANQPLVDAVNAFFRDKHEPVVELATGQAFVIRRHSNKY